MKKDILDIVHARRFIRKLRGGAQAHLIEGSDGYSYVVKFSNNLQHRRVLINEWLANRLMVWLSIATPVAVLIHVSSDFLKGNPDVSFETTRGRCEVEAGVHFGSRYAGAPGIAGSDFFRPTDLEQVVNPQDFAGTFVFDHWACNEDEPQVILETIKRGNRNRAPFRALMIDRGFSMGGTAWLLRRSQLTGLHSNRAIYDQIRSISDCEPWLSNIETMSEDMLHQMTRDIPPTWLADDEANLLILLKQLFIDRSRLRHSIISCATGVDRPFRQWGRYKPLKLVSAAPEFDSRVAGGVYQTSRGQVA